jgi:O-antigen/teichoic acid export membrane protein
MINDENKGSFLKHVMIYGTGTLLLQAGSFLLVPLYTYCLSKEDFGVLEIIARFGQAINICLMAQGIRLAATNYYKTSADINEKKQVVVTLFTMMFPLLSIGLILVYFFSDELVSVLQIPSRELLLLGVIAISFEALLSLPLTIIQARLESALYVKVTILQFLIRTITIIINVVIFNLGIRGILVAECIVFAFFCVVLIARELHIGSVRPDFTKYKRILTFTVPFVPAAALGFFIYSADRFFLVKYVGIAEVGLYALAMKLIYGVSTFVVAPVMSVWQTRMYDIFSSTNASDEVGLWYFRLYIAYVSAFFILIIFRNELFAVIAPTSYKSASIYILPLSIAIIAMCMANLIESALYFFHKTIYKIPVNLLSALTIGTLFITYTPTHGAMGTAICLVVGYLLHLFFTLIVVQRTFHVNFPLSKAAIYTSILVIVGCLCEIIPFTSGGIISKCLINILLFTWVIFCSQFIRESDREFVTGLLNKKFAYAKRN